jgi:hypothetical protein
LTIEQNRLLTLDDHERGFTTGKTQTIRSRAEFNKIRTVRELGFAFLTQAMLYPTTSPGKRSKSSATTLSETNKVSTARLS